MSDETKKARGFALMDPEMRREIARRGALAVHERGTAHQWNHETGKIAGRLGGIACGRKRAAERAQKEQSGA